MIILTWTRLLQFLCIAAMSTIIGAASFFIGHEYSFESFKGYSKGTCLLKILAIAKEDKAMQAWASSCIEMGGTPGWFTSFDGSLAGPRCEGMISNEDREKMR